MKNMGLNSFRWALVVLLSFCGFSLTLSAQEGVSSASVGVARAGFHQVGPNGQFMLPPPDFFRVEEFINYHRHDLPLPAEDTRVHLDVQKMMLENGKAVCQLGITTPKLARRDQVPPLNLVLVIDRSGSMSGGKLDLVKDATQKMVERFRKHDQISIVTFDHNANLHLDVTKKTKHETLTQSINSIEIGGSTNLHAGLMLGFGQALDHFDAERTNRIIFLTDGNANVGITESREIADASSECSRRGISLVTIGLGVDMNHGLLRELADSGRSLMHFVGDAKDIKKVFIDEYESLVAPAARNVNMLVDFGDSAKKAKVFGYQPQYQGNGRVKIKLDDLNCGATQVVMARLPVDKCGLTGSVKLTYVDAFTNEKVTVTKAIEVPCERAKASESIQRNYAIGLLANSLYKAAQDSHDGECRSAQKRLTNGLAKAAEWDGFQEDKNAQRVAKIVSEYLDKLNESLDQNRD